ncbi:hypothetical protein OF83DRAFT_1089598, partial [Amylostereum chailletii]
VSLHVCCCKEERAAWGFTVAMPGAAARRKEGKPVFKYEVVNGIVRTVEVEAGDRTEGQLLDNAWDVSASVSLQMKARSASSTSSGTDAKSTARSFFSSTKCCGDQPADAAYLDGRRKGTRNPDQALGRGDGVCRSSGFSMSRAPHVKGGFKLWEGLMFV